MQGRTLDAKLPTGLQITKSQQLGGELFHVTSQLHVYAYGNAKFTNLNLHGTSSFL